jgi:hypothetical protein
MAPPVARFLELRALFEECTEPYALVKPEPRLPAYARGARLEILCADPERFLAHLRRTLVAPAAGCFQFKESTDARCSSVDCIANGDSTLHLRIELHSTAGASPALAMAFARRARVMQHGVPLCFLPEAGQCELQSGTRWENSAGSTVLHPGQPASQEKMVECIVVLGDASARAASILAAVRARAELRIIANNQRQVASSSRLLTQLRSEPESTGAEDPAQALLIIAARRAGVAAKSFEAASGVSFHAQKEETVERTLAVFNLPPIGYFLREPNPEILAPYHLEPFARFALHQVPLANLRANLIGRSGIRIQETPHFLYASGDREPYLRYHANHMGRQLTDDHFAESFDRQIASYDPASDAAAGRKSYILGVRRSAEQFLIIDGLHRASILAARGVETVTLAEPLYR